MRTCPLHVAAATAANSHEVLAALLELGHAPAAPRQASTTALKACPPTAIVTWCYNMYPEQLGPQAAPLQNGHIGRAVLHQPLHAPAVHAQVELANNSPDLGPHHLLKGQLHCKVLPHMAQGPQTAPNE